MRPLIFILALSILSCGQSDTKQKELDLKEKELALKEKELALKEKDSNQDTPVQSAYSQDEIVSDPEKIISEIKAEFSRINSLSLTKKSFDWECEDGHMSGKTVYYFDKNSIVKVSLEEGTDHHESTTEHYYKDGKFIFSYAVLKTFPITGPGTKTEYRTYVNNDRVIRFLENQATKKPEKMEIDNASTEYKVLQAYTNKNFTGVLCD